MRKTLSPKTSLQVIIPLVCGTSAAMMLDQGFSIHHEAREGHEEGRTGLEKRPNFNMFFLCLRALRALRGGLHRINYQQRESLH
jgi:hypothetical protein